MDRRFERSVALVAGGTGALGQAVSRAFLDEGATVIVNGEVVMMSIEQGQYFGLDDIGSDIWKRLDPPCAFADLIDRLAADYDADRASIAADVRALLETMAERDVVRLA